MVPSLHHALKPTLCRAWTLSVILSTLAVSSPIDAQASRVVGPVTFEGEKWLGVDANDVWLDSFDGTPIPRVAFEFASAHIDLGGAAIRVGPEDAAYVDGQGLEGPSDSILTLVFEEPIVSFQAGMAFLSNRPEDLAVRLAASNDAGVSVFERNFASTIGSASLYPGTLVIAELDEPATRIRLRIESQARRFFLDNLVFAFEGAGLPGGPPSEANRFDGQARSAKTVQLADSRTVVTWPDEGAIRFQTVSPNGLPEDPIRIATATGQSGWSPALTPHAGGFALIWYGRPDVTAGPPEGIYLRLYNADGSARGRSTRLLSPLTRRASRITLGISSLGNALVVTWDDGEKLGAVRYDGLENATIPIALGTNQSSCGLHPLMLASASAMVWCADNELRARFFGQDGTPKSATVSLSEGISGTPRSVHVKTAATDLARSRVVMWSQEEDDDTAVYVRTLSAAGLLSPAVRVTSTLARNTTPAIAAAPDGSFLAAWLMPERPGVTELPRRLLAQAFYPTGVAATELLEPMSGLAVDPESIALTWNGNRATLIWENSVSSTTLPGSYLSTFEAEAQRSPCRASATSLCLQGNRFRVTVQYRDFDGVVGQGRPVSLTSDTGYFWFFDSGAADLVVKVLDGRASNGHHWVFFGSLTNVAFDLMVEDRFTGQTATYSNQIGAFASTGDTQAFESLGEATTTTSPRTQASAWSNQPEITAGTEQVDPVSGDELCAEALEEHPMAACLSERFLVQVQWEDFAGKVGDGRGQGISDDTASFWFFDAANLELVVKVLDGSAINDHFWVFFGSLTNVSFEMTVTDLQTGASRTWSNPGGTFASQGDTTALPAN